ncbi:Tn3 family transposase post-transcriptional regulator TnpC [Herminiimonas contaminans]|uniref:Hpt domain-containing protein n=1 Tax=Herminiimonas contaminans TaxID=1111140 RepID=A0ABS0EWC9_9BURK|nr:Tn3 family transposase post-transcriptional regulator TnpC [Herminiimonas contaminans]MBF8179151.1 hypothetical protein [Herminiimonas contaminans]
MNESRNTVMTAYGRLDETALLEVQNNYDTSVLLRIVEDLAELLSTDGDRDGLRHMLLRLHGMAHSVINGAGLTVSTEAETLPELAGEFIEEAEEMISRLQGWIKQIEPLEQLAVRS